MDLDTAPRAVRYPIEDEGPRILGVTLMITSVALLTMITRLFVRIKMIRNVGWDDYVMCSAMLLCITGQCIIIPEVRYGAGKHIDQIPPEDFQQGFKLNFITQPIFLVAICLVKLSVGLFLLRIAATPFYKRTIIGIMVFMGAYTLGCFFTIMLQCTNLAVQWDPDAKGTCWSGSTLEALSYTNVALNITTDILFAIVIPIPMLWHVQMNRRQKASIIGILALGIFATAAAIVKVGYLPNYGKEGDWLWDSRNITIWVVLETNVGIIAGNLPCLKPLFKSILGSTYGRGSRNRTASKYFSRHYQSGTDHRSTVNNNQYLPHKFESHMMTTIGVSKKDGSDTSSLPDGDSARQGSAGGVVLLDDQPQSFAQLGGILKTTEVSTEYNAPDSRGHDMEEGLRPEFKAKDLV